MVPKKGRNGACRSTPETVVVRSAFPSSDMRQIQTRSSSSGCRFGLPRVPDSNPKFGDTVAAPQSRAARSEARCTARMSPSRTPSTAIGPVSGFTQGKGATERGLPSGDVNLPPNVSSVNTSKGLTGMNGAAALVAPEMEDEFGLGRHVRTSCRKPVARRYPRISLSRRGGRNGPRPA